MKKFWLFRALANLLFALFTGVANIKYAIVQNPIIGRASGNVGKTRFSTWRGINYIASIGLKEDRKKQEMTDAVILNRDKMQLVGHTLISSSPFAQIAWWKSLTGTTPFASLVKFLRNKLTGSIGSIAFDNSKIINTVFGNGDPTLLTMTGVAASGSEIVVSIDPVFVPVSPDDSGDYIVNVFLINSDCTKWQYIPIASNLSESTFTVELASNYEVGEKIYIWFNVTHIPDEYSDLKSTVFKALANSTPITLIA